MLIGALEELANAGELRPADDVSFVATVAGA